MAKFSLTLINNRGATVLTQYDALTNETAGLTFDENLQLSVDGSTLSFSMLKYLYEGSQKVTNTAALSIIYGSIIRCEYNTKRYDFAVTDIKYNFMSENLRLDFTATDYFQFENSQIGVGYTITTDTTDPEYLGAMPIDEWVYKIIRDNNIRWTYTPINTANQDVINILNNINEKTALYSLTQDETQYWEQVEESKTLNTWVSFECSNSSAFAALKQLATDNELIIEVNYSNHSFCFKPQKSFIFNGYYFNPSNNLQAFSVQGNADNLITVLNITGGKDLNNQEITLVPSIPAEVATWINSGPSYTKTTYDWLFTDWYVTREGNYMRAVGDIVNNTDNALGFTLNYEWDGTTYSELITVPAHSTLPYDRVTSVSSEYQNLTLSVDTNGEPTQILLEFPPTWDPVSIHSQHSVTDTFAGWDDSIYYPGLYDKYAVNYPQFVREIAYTPWFENKLIDVSYFTNNNLLLPAEVFEIQDILYNRLRRINGHLIVAETTYLQKYEQDYMDINQKRIDAETLNARLYGDINTLTQAIDYSKPPIFITKGDNGEGVKNWVYIAPGTSLYASLSSDYTQITLQDLCVDGALKGIYSDYLGPNPQGRAVKYDVPLSTSSIKVSIYETGEHRIRSGYFIQKNSDTYSITTDDSSQWILTFDDLGLNTTVKTISLPYQTNITYFIDCVASSRSTYSIQNGQLINQTGQSATFANNTLTISGTGITNCISVHIAIVSMSNYSLYSNSSNFSNSLAYENENNQLQFHLTQNAGPQWRLNDYIQYGSDVKKFYYGDYNYDLISGTTYYYIFNLSVDNVHSLPRYVYVKDNLPDTIKLITKTQDNIASTELVVTPSNIEDISFSSLIEAQNMGLITPTHNIAGLTDYLNTHCNTREAMLQHLADNWGLLLQEWYRSFAIGSTTHYLSDIYATYRKIGILDNGIYEIMIGQPWSSVLSQPVITEDDINILRVLCNVYQQPLMRSTVISTMQLIHTKITEYWTQCYNAAMSLGLYWPQNWDCIDILENDWNDSTNNIFPFNAQLLGLVTGDGMSDAYRWQPGSPLLNLYFTPHSKPVPNSATFSDYNLKSGSAIYYTTITSSSLWMVLWNLNLTLSYTDSEGLINQTVNTFNGTTDIHPNQTLFETILDLPGATYGVYPEESHTGCRIYISSLNSLQFQLIIQTGYYNPSQGSSQPSTLTYDTYLNGIFNIAGYKSDNAKNQTVYAHSYKFMDDNDSWRPIRIRSDQTQFDYQLIPSTNDHPYSQVLAQHADIQDNLHLYKADLRYKVEHYTNFDFSTCKLPSQWLAAAVDFIDGTAPINPSGEASAAANPNLAFILYLAKAAQYNNTEYYKYLDQHNKLWQHMYQQFPGVFRESNFTNTTAITSQELYESARRELDKVSQPAYQYSLTGMDIYMHDSDYEPTRIKLGDQIRIDYQELNELNDSLNAALREPLYITGITHTLRNDGDYQFTVTTRSATDTMLQRFANILMFK